MILLELLEELKADHRLSRLCQQAVDLDTELEALPDVVRDDAMKSTAACFFDEWRLSGSYAICNDELIRDEATAHEMRLDLDALGILVGNLMTALQDLWDLEKKYALRKAVVLRKFRINADV